MNRQNIRPEYESPPRRWPFPTLGRNAFLLTGAALLALTLTPFLGSIAVAGVFALGLSGPIDKISRVLGHRRRLASGLVVAALTVLVLFPATFFGMRVYQAIAGQEPQNISGLFSPETAEKVSAAMNRLEELMVEYGVGSRLFESSFDVQEAIRETFANLFRQGMSALSSLVVSLPEFVLGVLVFGLFLYVFLSYPRQIKRFTFRLHLFRPDDLKRSIRILKASSYNSLVANFLVGLLQASIITAGARAVGYGESVLIFSIIFVLSYIPFIGSAPVGYLLALVSLITDGLAPAATMAIVASFAGLIDNVVRPYLVANGGVSVHPVLSFACILGAIAVFGLKGIFLGPVILTGTVAFLGNPRTVAPDRHQRGILKRLKSTTAREKERKLGA